MENKKRLLREASPEECALTDMHAFVRNLVTHARKDDAFASTAAAGVVRARVVAELVGNATVGEIQETQENVAMIEREYATCNLLDRLGLL